MINRYVTAMRKSKVPVDKAGREIKPGVFIIYGHAIGRSAALQYGKVVALKTSINHQWDYSFTPPQHVPVTVYHFTVQGVSYYGEEASKPSLLRRGTLQFGDRILVLHDDQVPISVREVLDAVPVEATEPQPTPE